MMSESNFDVVVVGGGPIGLAAAYNCAARNQSVVVLEQYNLFNQSGSSNDLVRMFRTMYTEDFMADFAKESIDLWRELESDAGESLILMTGLLNFGDPNYQGGPEGNITAPIKNLERLHMPYRELNAKQIMAEYPFRDLPDDFIGVFAPDNGCINVPLVLRALYRLATAHGAHIIPHAPVQELKVSEDGVEVVANLGEPQTFSARRCIVTCGAYTNNVLSSIGIKLNLLIWEMVYEYYATAPGPRGTLFPSMWFQFLGPTGGDPARSNLFYGFPTVPWGPPNLARIAVDNAANIIFDPAQRQIVPAANDLAITADFVRSHCVGVDDRPNFCGTCLQTNVPDNMYVLDFLPSSVPGHRNVAVLTAGWAFKFVPLIGRILSQLILDGSTGYDISHFQINRPGVLA
jgi:sarcosine oxidase / L-pipecolate oxidase